MCSVQVIVRTLTFACVNADHHESAKPSMGGVGDAYDNGNGGKLLRKPSAGVPW